MVNTDVQNRIFRYKRLGPLLLLSLEPQSQLFWRLQKLEILLDNRLCPRLSHFDQSFLLVANFFIVGAMTQLLNDFRYLVSELVTHIS